MRYQLFIRKIFKCKTIFEATKKIYICIYRNISWANELKRLNGTSRLKGLRRSGLVLTEDGQEAWVIVGWMDTSSLFLSYNMSFFFSHFRSLPHFYSRARKRFQLSFSTSSQLCVQINHNYKKEKTEKQNKYK